MQFRAALVATAFLGLTILPLASGAGPHLAAAGLGCWDRMLQEMGWDQASLDSPEGLVDPLPAGFEGSILPAPADTHDACQGKIQPGAQMTSGCTMNFIFRDQAGRLYLGTAGHCTGGVGSGIGIQGVGSRVATVVFDGYPGATDFALARIDPAFYNKVDPTMCHWGGPAAVNTNPSLGQTTHIYGFGLIYGTNALTRARAGVIFSPSVSEVTYVGFAQPGDSGSPLMSGDGNALGVHVRSSLSLGPYRVDPSPKFATRLDYALGQAEASTGLDLELVPGLAPFNLLAGVA